MNNRTFINFLICGLLLFAVALFVYSLSQKDFSPGSSQFSPHVAQTTEPATNARDIFCLNGCPTGMPVNDLLVVHHILELENNPTTKFADWVAYKITTSTLGKGCKREWRADPDLDQNVTLIPQDYKGIRAALASDRGHQAPLASLCGSPYWQEADYLSNITPQRSDLNEGPWEHLENGERKLIEDGYSDAVYSITGPLYEKVMPPLPNAHLQHRVPSGYWKIISVIHQNKFEVAAFIMPQEIDRAADYCSFNVLPEKVEQRTGLYLFSKIPADQKLHIDTERAPEELKHALGCS